MSTSLQRILNEPSFPSWAGFGRLPTDLLSWITDEPKYPPCNIVKFDKGYRIELAVPGWCKEELEVYYYGGILTVKGSKKDELEGDETYHYKGLSTKAFTRKFTVGGDLDVEDVWVENGMLYVSFFETGRDSAKSKNLLT